MMKNVHLYDVGIGEINNDVNYVYDNNANIYYNKDNYIGDKLIIGKLILNDGQPCYNVNEKLWRTFYEEEAADNHLKCDLKIFGKLIDDRYENKGDITYKKIYEDNLSTTSKELLIENIKDEKISLYKRVFLGIDKECDEKSDISKEQYKKLKDNQRREKILVLVEGILLLSFFLLLLIFFIIICCSGKERSMEIFSTILFVFLLVSGVLCLACIICQSVFIGRIISNNLFYDCSDSITNEVIRQENINTKKSITWTASNLGVDVFFLVYIGLIVLISYLKEKCKYCSFNFHKKESIKPVNMQEKNLIKSDDIYNKPVREVFVENKPTPVIISDNKNISKEKNNDICNNNDIISQNQKLVFDVPPPAAAL